MKVRKKTHSCLKLLAKIWKWAMTCVFQTQSTLGFFKTLVFLWSHACTTYTKILLVVWRECQEEDSSPLLHSDKHWQGKNCICETLAS